MQEQHTAVNKVILSLWVVDRKVAVALVEQCQSVGEEEVNREHKGKHQDQNPTLIEVPTGMVKKNVEKKLRSPSLSLSPSLPLPPSLPTSPSPSPNFWKFVPRENALNACQFNVEVAN